MWLIKISRKNGLRRIIKIGDKKRSITINKPRKLWYMCVWANHERKERKKKLEMFIECQSSSNIYPSNKSNRMLWRAVVASKIRKTNNKEMKQREEKKSWWNKKIMPKGSCHPKSYKLFVDVYFFSFCVCLWWRWWYTVSSQCKCHFCMDGVIIKINIIENRSELDNKEKC